MVSRIQNRNTGYSENLFSQSPRVENNTLSSIDGATALKLDESYQLQEEEQSSSFSNFENSLENENLIGDSTEAEKVTVDIPSGVSIESASYIENNNFEENNVDIQWTSKSEEEEYTPKLFSEEQDFQSEETSKETTEEENKESDQLFDQDINEEEDFEIPAFLRKQKF